MTFLGQRGYTWVGHLYGEYRNNYMVRLDGVTRACIVPCLHIGG